MAADPLVASRILDHLGGYKFIAMTGAQALTYTDRSVDYQINGRHDLVGSINRLRIELALDDTYTITIYRQRKLECKQLEQKTGVYAENLRSWIENLTGLRTSL
jgi:hypothetical protein